MVYRKNTDRMDFILNTRNNTVLVQQKWKYSWQLAAGTTQWTQSQRRNFHGTADRLIWRLWAGRYKLKCRGTSTFARNNRNTEFTVNFDIKWTLTHGHWKVIATKILPGGFRPSQITWATRIIQLDTEDNQVRNIRLPGLATIYRQYPVTHEFGHTIGNTSGIRGMHADEYNSTNIQHLRDRNSILNIGRELRTRHLDYILNELHSLIPNTTFYMHQVLNS